VNEGQWAKQEASKLRNADDLAGH